ncbi:MAG: anthranilate phosphoribosyltransferase [Phycisphaerales bacterium JB059]
MQIHDALAQLVAQRSLGEQGAESIFEQMLTGSLDDAQIGALLGMIQARGPSVDELVGAARVMRRHVEPVPTPQDPARPVIDTCGTGGAPKTFNVSTAAALVVAGARPEPGAGVERVLVAKHGNRSRTGRGSAEVLQTLGVNVDASPEVQGRCLEEAGVCFCFAIHHHPAARHAVPVRRSLGVPTMFNLLGPLTNPANAPRQLLGVWDRRFVDPLAQALLRLGAERAWVVHSDDGLDELSITDRTHVGVVADGSVSSQHVDPAPLGLACPSLDLLRASDVEHAARMIRDIVEGRPGPPTDMTLLSAGAALHVAGAAASLDSGVELARDSIATGRASQALTDLARLSETG